MRSDNPGIFPFHPFIVRPGLPPHPLTTISPIVLDRPCSGGDSVVDRKTSRWAACLSQTVLPFASNCQVFCTYSPLIFGVFSLFREHTSPHPSGRSRIIPIDLFPMQSPVGGNVAVRLSVRRVLWKYSVSAKGFPVLAMGLLNVHTSQTAQRNPSNTAGYYMSEVAETTPVVEGGDGEGSSSEVTVMSEGGGG